MSRDSGIALGLETVGIGLALIDVGCTIPGGTEFPTKCQGTKSITEIRRELRMVDLGRSG